MKNVFLVALCVSFGLVSCQPGAVRPKDPTPPPVTYEYPAVKKEAANKMAVLLVRPQLVCTPEGGFNARKYNVEFPLCAKQEDLKKMEDAINTKLIEIFKNRGFELETVNGGGEIDFPSREKALFLVSFQVELKNVYSPKKEDVLSPGKEIDKKTGEETPFIEAIRYNGTLQTTASFSAPLMEPLSGLPLRKDPTLSVSTGSPTVYAEWYNPDEKPPLLNSSDFGLGVSIVQGFFKKEADALPPRAAGSENLRIVQNKQLSEVYKLVMAKLDSLYTTADLKKYVNSANNIKKKKVY